LRRSIVCRNPHRDAHSPSRNPVGRWAAAVLAVVTAVCAAACAGPPSNGGIRTAPLSQSHNNVFIVAREPAAGMTPVQLVDGFLHALTGDQKDPGFSVAQDYLTDSGRKNWVAPAQTMIVTGYSQTEDLGAPADHISYPAAGPSTTTPVGATEKITVSGTEVAQLDALGFLSYPSTSQQVQQEFTVKNLGGTTGWRIDTAPKFRIVEREAFKRVYQTYQSALPVYLPEPGDQIPHMDQVYLTQATGRAEYTYDALARAVLHGRYQWENTQLQLDRPVTVSPTGVATVVLKTPPAGQRDITNLDRALGLTFRDASATQQLLSATPVTSMYVTYAGCAGSFCGAQPLPQQAVPVPPVYWMCSQSQYGPQAVLVSSLLPTGQNPPCLANVKAQPVVDLSGVQRLKDSPVAVKQAVGSGDVRSPAAPLVTAVVDSVGNVRVISDKNPANHPIWYTAAIASQVTDLEWDPVDGSLWVVDDGNLYRVQDPGGKGASSVDSQNVVLFSGGQVSKFKPSPDGDRAVVVAAQTGAGVLAPVAMVTIDRTGGVPSLTPSTAFGLLGSTWQTPTDPLQSATDAAWADGRTVAVLGLPGNSNTPKLLKVYLDGTQDSAISGPEDAQPGAKHIAATTGVTSTGHASVWLMSDGSGPTDSGGAGAYVYFKKSGGTESSQVPGSTPLVATTAMN
jgi:hypothetical protein